MVCMYCARQRAVPWSALWNTHDTGHEYYIADAAGAALIKWVTSPAERMTVTFLLICDDTVLNVLLGLEGRTLKC